ncbi:aldehyde dehydrogenase family protein [Caminibacter mediatlanticus]|uniref:Aldehyde dehydrogenase n=1 Tax=Caminibacter mediatlanticus TB-2 TaxID=391592 RepID=A0AAI9F258_9BACT|nr:aldehyde dehydrogenase family protein [Caminibacter mediatlanticus]EDM23463.1 Aldehyde dehydrogenase [Caminibacter mediatlanticus TB-2]
MALIPEKFLEILGIKKIEEKELVAKKLIGSSEENGEVKEIINPYTKQPTTKYVKCNIEDAKRALEVAKNAFENTKKSTLAQRIAWIEDVAKKLQEKKEEFAKYITLEVAKPISHARVEVERCIENLKICAAEGYHILGETIPTDATFTGAKTTAFYKRVPAGVVVAITPFNFPLNLVAHKLGPALIAGNSVVLKPTPEAPYTAYAFAKLFIESEYAIPNALSVVYGDADVGSTLVTSPIPRVISFTGSVAVGKIITQSAGIKKVSLELGGNAATFIESSANLDYAASRCAVGAFANSGQVCISLQRIYVDEKVYEEFAKKLGDEASKLKVGNPFEEDTFMGPLINEEAAIRAENWIKSAVSEGARIIAGGKREGNILYPTILADVTDDMKIVCEEVFAPIVSLVKVRGYEEAVEKMNNSPYGLQYSMFSNRVDLMNRAIEDFEAGGVIINDIPTLRFDIQPYGGIKLSGIGREGPKFAIEEMTEIKSIIIR